MIFLNIFTSIFGFFGKIFNYLLENPKVFLCIVSAIVLAGISYNFGYNRGMKEQSNIDAPIIESYKKQEEEREKKIRKLELDSFEFATMAQTSISETKKNLDIIQSQYAKEKTKKNLTLIKINDARFKNGSLDVNVDSNGVLICNKFPESYKESVNRMIQEANK